MDVSTVAELGFYLLTGGYCIFSAILYYHWKTYAMNRRAISYTLWSYFLVTVPLIGFIGFTSLAI